MAADVRRAVVRARDLLVAELHFHDLVLDPAGDRLNVVAGGEPLIVLHLPPQHVAEQAFWKDDEISDEKVAAMSRIAGPTRVAFRLPAGVATVPLRLVPLLELLEKCELRVVDAALPRSEDPSPPGCLPGLVPWLSGVFGGPGPALRAPTEDETWLELPFRLILSPPRELGFVHRPQPVVGDAGWSELWHSRLGVAPRDLGALDDDRTVRGVWLRTGDHEAHVWHPEAPLPVPAEDDIPFETALDHNARHQIVHLSANFAARFGRPRVPIYPRAIAVRRLGLTSLGATLDLRGEWDPPLGLSLAEWVHRAGLGRDHFVRLVRVGWLFPFGHRARRVDIYERRFHHGSARAALVRVRRFVVVRQPLREYSLATAPTPQLGRTMPLRRVEVRTLITPALEDALNDRAFEMRDTNGVPVPFHLVGTDGLGQLAEFRTPLWFVSQEASDPDIDAAVAGFGERVVPVDGDGSQPGGGVPLELSSLEPSDPAGQSTWSVRSITWRGDKSAPAGGEEKAAPFHPRAASLALRLPEAEAVAAAPATTSVSFHQRYVEHGLDPAQNPGAVLASMAKIPFGFAGKGDRAGGLVRPELDLSGLSRKLGPIAGAKLDDIASGAFNPSDFFAGALPKLFGTLELDRLLKATGLLDGPLARAPKLLRSVDGAELTWQPQLRDYPDPPKALFVTNPQSKLTLKVSAQGAASEVDCVLESFTLRLVPDFECIELHFTQARFAAKAAKPDIDVQLDRIEFVGALSFVETLRKVIPLDGFSDPPALNVTPRGADATFSLSLPSLTLGMFSLENISFGAGFLVPFDERSISVRFNFCQRHEPFLLTVSALGGGGFFLIEVDARDVQRLEASLEFGASLSIDFGVASGGVHVMAGIYFAYESSKGASLTGYFRLGGNVDALGLLSVSIELYLSLSYQPSSGKAVGVATLTIEVEVFLFSASIEIRCERKFAGSKSDPTFEEVLSAYTDSEAAEAAAAGFELEEGTWPWEQYWKAYA
jgi:hypothetical protein